MPEPERKRTYGHIFRNIKKYCLRCGLTLKLNNSRDILRKNYCSHACCTIHIQTLGKLSPPPRPTPDMYIKTGLKYRGENHWHYYKDRNSVKRKRNNCSDRDMIEYFKKEIFRRDNYTCQITGEKGGKLEAHHLFNWADYPEKRYQLDNCVTLSKPVHKLFHHIYKYRNISDDQYRMFKEVYYASPS